MQHANRHREIEVPRCVRQDIAVISLVLNAGMTAPRLGDARRGDIRAAKAAEHAPHEGMKFADAAADIEQAVGLGPLPSGEP